MKSKDLLELEQCFHCYQYPVPNQGEAYCLVCLPWLKERQEWKERVFKRDEIIKGLEKDLALCQEKLNQILEKYDSK